MTGLSGNDFPSSAQRSSGLVSTTVGDHVGIPGVVLFFFLLLQELFAKVPKVHSCRIYKLQYKLLINTSLV
jgi:hypothetical protein